LARITLDKACVDFPVFDARGRSLRNALVSVGSAVAKRVEFGQQGHTVVHALSDLSLDITDGDRIGLIGPNGSGKSTLLRLLAGVYEPTAGTIRIEGQPRPLLDLTLGVDIDATGHDNIRLRGLALGLSLKEIIALEQEIAEFTQLGDHLNLPVRTYSSGMLLRLAFGVSTCTPSDIFVIDEVIGVGDAAFMERASARFRSMIDRTSVLVLASHSPAILQQFCNKGLVLEEGRTKFLGSINEAITFYNTPQP